MARPKATTAPQYAPYLGWKKGPGIDPLFIWAEKTKWCDFNVNPPTNLATFAAKFPVMGDIDNPSVPVYTSFPSSLRSSAR
jgi:hypothetical protein